MTEPSSHRDRIGDTAIEAATAGGGAVAGWMVGGVEGAVLGATAGPVARQIIDRLVGTFTARRQERVVTLIHRASSEAQLDPDALIDHFESQPELEELLSRTVQAAQDAALDEKLYALSTSLASGALATDSAAVQWETGFVRALAELDTPHLRLLQVIRRFAQKPDNPLAKDAPPSVTVKRLKVNLPDLASILETLIATMQARGLIAPVQAQMATIGSPTARIDEWYLTDFGNEFLERMLRVGEVMSERMEDRS